MVLFFFFFFHLAGYAKKKSKMLKLEVHFSSHLSITLGFFY